MPHEKPDTSLFRTQWTPEHWASLVPFGFGEQRPNNYAELWRALVENRDELGFAWRILSQGVCDGCALGTKGMTDWTLPGVHLCNIRLRLLRLNTMPALDPKILADVAPLRAKSSAELRELGRVPYPMMRKRGEAGFRRIGWDHALDLIAARIRAAGPQRAGFYLTSRGMPNEAYYCAQKAVRAMGSANIDNAARVCHAASTVALKRGIGVGATTCSYNDFFKTDLIVFIGSNVANNQPVATKYLHFAKKNGAKIVVLNNYREPGMERYWIPSLPESALFGTKLADQFHLLNIGGDIAFLNGTLKHVFAHGWHDADFVAQHTEGVEALRAALDAQSWEDLEEQSGLSRDDMLDFARTISKAERAIFVWSMGITQHASGVANVSAILNLALSKGYVGREGCGVMPIRGHSGVQGGAEMGAYANALPGGLPVNAENAARFEALWGFDVPQEHGLNAVEMLDAAHAGALDTLFSVGGNFLEVLPDPAHVEEALARVPLRVHYDIVLSSQMLVDPADTVVILPAATRYETPGGVTETSTERRVILSPEIPGRRIGEARPEWEVLLDLARRVRPDLAERLHFADTAAVRQEIAEAVPFYDGIQHLQEGGASFQYGGEHLCAGAQFNTPDGKAHFWPVSPERPALAEGHFLVTTRRGKQFNSMVHEHKDSITGARREAVFMNPADATALGVGEGQRIRLVNATGSMEGHVRLAPVKRRNLQVHWPEGNVLLDRATRSPECGEPDYNATVTIEVLA